MRTTRPYVYSLAGNSNKTTIDAAAIVRLLEEELSERVVYLHRARLLVSLARDVGEVMDRTEAAGVESDFTATAWHALRVRLTTARKQFEGIIAGGDCSMAPCGTKQVSNP